MTATNSLGWEVQAYNRDTGWKPVVGPFPDRDSAYAEMRKLGMLGNGYFRVYEALNHPTIKRN